MTINGNSCMWNYFFQHVPGVSTVTSHGNWLGLHLPRTWLWTAAERLHGLYLHLRQVKCVKKSFLSLTFQFWCTAGLQHHWSSNSSSPFYLFLLSEDFSHTHPADWPKYTTGSGSVCQISVASIEICSLLFWTSVPGEYFFNHEVLYAKCLGKEKVIFCAVTYTWISSVSLLWKPVLMLTVYFSHS